MHLARRGNEPTESVYDLFQKQISERAPYLNADTNSIRLFDGSGDGLLETYLDQLGEHWLLSTHDGLVDESLRRALSQFDKSVYWKKLDQHEKESPSLLCGDPVEEDFIGRENGLNYKLSFDSGYSQGLFLDQRENRARVMEMVEPGQKVLNTFAYTGAFSVAAASAGATTTTLDLSQPYLNWAKENMELNSIDPTEHYFCKGDTFHWLGRFAKSGKQFDGVILDPPTFSRDSKGKVFRVEKDYHRLVKLACELLTPGGWILACTNCRKLPAWEFEEQLIKGAGEGASLEALPMPPEYTEAEYLKSYLVRL